MKSIEMNAEARQAWLRRLQGLPPVETPPPAQSDFEQSLTWKIAIAFACIAIGIQTLAPDPDAPLAPINPSTVQTGRVRTTV